MFWSIAFVGTAAAFWGPTVTVLALSMLIWSISRARFVRRRIASSNEPQSLHMFGAAYWTVVVLEFLLAAGTVLFLIVTGRSQLIPPAIAFIVELHFLPLTKLYRMPTLFVTGTSLVILTVVCLVIPRANIRNLIVCLEIGLSMWARTFVTLRQVVSHLKAPSAA